MDGRKRNNGGEREIVRARYLQKTTTTNTHDTIAMNFYVT
jgi:hypothetical protein